MVKVYKYYQDAGHGWLAVKRSELVELGIANKITSYSYQRGKTVYLEEDCDMTTFVNALTARDNGISFVVQSSRTNPNKLDMNPAKNVFFEVKYCERSPIRSYDGYVS